MRTNEGLSFIIEISIYILWYIDTVNSPPEFWLLYGNYNCIQIPTSNMHTKINAVYISAREYTASLVKDPPSYHGIPVTLRWPIKHNCQNFFMLTKSVELWDTLSTKFFLTCPTFVKMSKILCVCWWYLRAQLV